MNRARPAIRPGTLAGRLGWPAGASLQKLSVCSLELSQFTKSDDRMRKCASREDPALAGALAAKHHMVRSGDQFLGSAAFVIGRNCDADGRAHRHPCA